MSTEKSFEHKYRKPTPVCKHCKNLNAKYPHIRFDHWLRESPDPNSRIVCPQLKDTECTWCGHEGHTKKYCKDFIRYIQERNGFDALAERLLEQYKHRKIEEAALTCEELSVECNKDTDILIRPPSPLHPPPPHILKEQTTKFPVLTTSKNTENASKAAAFWGKFR